MKLTWSSAKNWLMIEFNNVSMYIVHHSLKQFRYYHLKPSNQLFCFFGCYCHWPETLSWHNNWMEHHHRHRRRLVCVCCFTISKKGVLQKCLLAFLIRYLHFVLIYLRFACVYAIIMLDQGQRTTRIRSVESCRRLGWMHCTKFTESNEFNHNHNWIPIALPMQQIEM